MPTLSRLFALSLVLVVSACASLTPHQRAYAVGAISKTVIDQADREFWDPFVTARTNACDPDNNPSITTDAEFDACLGPAVHDAKVVAALEVYVTAADTLFTLLKATESDAAALQIAKQRVRAAAAFVLTSMGDKAKPYLETLTALTRGK